ncbi:hypothetical protein GA0070609_4969 [Micromonospora echinaurantiaca]|uniref:Intracellular proteinase inhibitor BsuPI domain-containing protein n=1 Tax=Micromonospora echinaurantiaca TaxID=47857 RepID=A0A1C5JUH1_9ACTN|nr:hypothetical protein [Micromonospora echinaurantiaca]SCG74250.1 hypothetical protein GA0070609_4969 [Micromonospora echinaurantiaca]
MRLTAMSRWSGYLPAVAILGVVVLAGCARSAPDAAPATAGPTATTGGVTVTVAAERYRAGEVIVLTVANDSGRTLFADDLRTDCSPVLLERREDGTWTGYDNCGVERASSVVVWAPGERRELRLDTAGSSFSATPLPAGSYRITFGFRRSSTPEGTVAERVHSADFRIG